MLKIRLSEKRQNSPLPVDHHGDLSIQPAVAQAMLYLFRLDPKTANLHLIITASAEDDAVSRPLGHIAGTVGTHQLPIRFRQPHITLGGKLGVVYIAQAHTGSDDVQLPLSLLGHGLQLLVQNPRLAVSDRSAQMPVAAGRS